MSQLTMVLFGFHHGENHGGKKQLDNNCSAYTSSHGTLFSFLPGWKLSFSFHLGQVMGTTDEK
jgi:hypothetical protein